jgi:hypothetical protein
LCTGGIKPRFAQSTSQEEERERVRDEDRNRNCERLSNSGDASAEKETESTDKLADQNTVNVDVRNKMSEPQQPQTYYSRAPYGRDRPGGKATDKIEKNLKKDVSSKSSASSDWRDDDNDECVEWSRDSGRTAGRRDKRKLPISLFNLVSVSLVGMLSLLSKVLILQCAVAAQCLHGFRCFTAVHLTL